MYELFLESKAAKQCKAYAEQNNMDAEELLQKCYTNNKMSVEAKRKNIENVWVDKCLKNNSHIQQSVDNLFTWNNTPEGHVFWSKVHTVRLA